MKKTFYTNTFLNTVAADGWEVLDSGRTRDIDYNRRCLLIAKKQKLAEICKTPASKSPKKHAKSRVSATPPKTVMVNSRDGGVCHESSSSIPCSESSDNFVIDLPVCLSSLRPDDERYTIRAESFWIGRPDNVISYNFSIIVDDYILTAVFFVFDDIIRNLSIDYLLGRFLDIFAFGNRYDRRNVISFEYIPYLTPSGKPKVCSSSSKHDANSHAAYLFDKPNNRATTIPINDEPKSNSCDYKRVKTTCDYKSNSCIPITLLFNFGLKFFSSIDVSSAYSSNILQSHSNIITELHHGIFTSQSFNHFASSYVCGGWNHCYLLNIDIRDAVCLNCCGNDNSIPEIYGKYCDCYQYDFNVKGFEGNFKKLLDKYLAFCPLKYLQYACSVNNNILIFQSRIWGINRSMPCTVTSAACKVAQDFISKDLGCSNILDFHKMYSGVKEVSSKLRLTLQNQFARNCVRFPINDAAETVQRFGSLSYTGGCNACFSVVVHHGQRTFDVDICSAYPTAMMLVPAIDYGNPIARHIPANHILSIADFVDDTGDVNPMLPMFARVTYRFPDDCLYPNLKRNNEDDDKAPCYPLSEDNPVYCSGPELYAALQLGAKITVINGVVANVLRDDKGETMYPYRNIVRMLVRARADAAKIHGKNCLEAKLYKFIINSLYGKIAQNVHDMYSPDKTRLNNAESLITNNVSASLITSFVRSVLFASFYGINNAGYNVYSATTDGLITDMPFDEFNRLHLFGLRDCLTTSRSLITDDTNPKVWEVKHAQTDLFNITTRGNASLIVADPDNNVLGGVIARNGACSEFPDLPKESSENRKAFILNVASRTGKIPANYKIYTLLADVQKACPYTESTHTKQLSMDFDMKRKPLKDSLCAEHITIDGETYEIAHIGTVPFENNAEYLLYKAVADKQKCLRTVADWTRFFNDIDCAVSGVASGPREDENYRWKCFRDCVAGYRAGMWDIPYLNAPGLSVKQKVEWLQSINDCPSHIFNRKTWDKLSEKSYIKNILPYDILEPTLDRIVSLCPVCESETEVTESAIKQSDSADNAPCVSSVTVSTVDIKPEKYLEVDGIKMYFDDENEELLNESLNSPYYDNPYADDEDDSINDSHTFEIYDGEIPDSLDYGDDFDDEPDSGYDSRRYISKTFDAPNNNDTSKSDNSVVNMEIDLPPEIDYSLIDDDYLPY